MNRKVIPIFVVGSPRSGTTLTGNFIGSSKNVHNLNEYIGHAFTHILARKAFRNSMMPYKEQYIRYLQLHTAKFAEQVTTESGCSFYSDSTPWNLLIVDELLSDFPEAIFVLCLRHYLGVIQSLKESFERGHKWAGKTWQERACLWSNFYSNVCKLRRSNLIVISYDKLCREPSSTIKTLMNKLNKEGVEISNINLAEFAYPHAANNSEKKKTLAKITNDGVVTFNPIYSFNPELLGNNIASKIDEIQINVAAVDKQLRLSFPNDYEMPYVPTSFDLTAYLTQR